MKKVIIFLILIVSGTVYVSCDSNTYKEIATVTNPTYTDNIAPVFKSNCTSCHSEAGSRSDSPLETYEQVKASVELAPGDGGILCYIDDPSACFTETIMPPTGRMPQTTIDMIKLWKEQGFAQ